MACANLANLLLVRASGRRREMQLRTALGASMGQVLGQMTAESAVLVGIGGTAASARSRPRLDVLPRATWISLARIGDVQVGWPAIAFAAAPARRSPCSLAAWRCCTAASQRARWAAAARWESRRNHAPSTRSGWRSSQVALVVVLTVTGGLLLRSLTRCSTSIPDSTRAARWRSASIRQGAARVPTVCHSSIRSSSVSTPCLASIRRADDPPADGRPSEHGLGCHPAGREHNPADRQRRRTHREPGYFPTAGIRILEGRDFDCATSDPIRS